jgi:putative peptide zinc metalloprotease protein
VHQQADELAKYQAELANRESLEKKHAEVQRRVADLTARAPADGRLISRSFDWLPGQYLQAGDEIAILGSESAKELLVAVDQQDLELFRSQVGSARTVRVSDLHCRRFDAPLAPLEPRASQEPPHPALLATAGGPLAAMPRGEEEQPAARDLPDHKLLTPCFTGHVPLSPVQSRGLLCGQLLEVGFRSSRETIAQRVWLTLQRWIGDQLAQRRP